MTDQFKKHSGPRMAKVHAVEGSEENIVVGSPENFMLESVVVPDPEGNQPVKDIDVELIGACRRGDLKVIRKLLLDGANINVDKVRLGLHSMQTSRFIIEQ